MSTTIADEDGPLGVSLPDDLVELGLATVTHNHTRQWFQARMATYYLGSPRKAYVRQHDIDVAINNDSFTIRHAGS